MCRVLSQPLVSVFSVGLGIPCVFAFFKLLPAGDGAVRAPASHVQRTLLRLSLCFGSVLSCLSTAESARANRRPLRLRSRTSHSPSSSGSQCEHTLDRRAGTWLPALRCALVCTHLFVHTKHSEKAGPFAVARLKMDLPFHNRLAYNRSQEKCQPSL